MTFSHIHDAATFLIFRDRMARVIDRIAHRHAAELRRTWKTKDFLTRSEAQRRRWAKQKGQQA